MDLGVVPDVHGEFRMKEEEGDRGRVRVPLGEGAEFTGEGASVEAFVATRAPVNVVAASSGDMGKREAGQYYRERVQEGGLWPADAETAEACGVVLDPTFGGEYPELIAAPLRKPKGD